MKADTSLAHTTPSAPRARSFPPNAVKLLPFELAANAVVITWV